MKVKPVVLSACLLALVSATDVVMAQNPFSGIWKLDQEKSELAGDTMKFGAAEAQSIELTAGGTSYSFRIDGNNYRMASGDLAAWKQIDPNTWTTEYRRPDGKPLSTDTWKLSADGQNLSVVSTGTKPNGDIFTDTAAYTRIAGKDGLMGSWKSTMVKLSSPNELTIESNGLSGLVLKIAAIKATCLANFDGKDATPTGPTVPPGLTLSILRTAPNSFRLTQKINGAPSYSATYTVSADGKTMTEVGSAPGDPPQTAIWEKQ
jgi:hypothetical protein